MRERLAIVMFIGLIALTACSSPPRDFRIWTTVDGGPVAPTVIQMRRGVSHCDTENTWFLRFGDLSETAMGPAVYDGAEFVLDAEGVVPSTRLKAEYESGAVLPSDAVFTGFVSEGAELWTSETFGGDAVFLVNQLRAELLPGSTQRILCD